MTVLCNWLPVHSVQGIRVQTRRGGVQLGDEVAPQLQHSETVSYRPLFRIITVHRLELSLSASDHQRSYSPVPELRLKMSQR